MGLRVQWETRQQLNPRSSMSIRGKFKWHNDYLRRHCFPNTLGHLLTHTLCRLQWNCPNGCLEHEMPGYFSAHAQVTLVMSLAEQKHRTCLIIHSFYMFSCMSKQFTVYIIPNRCRKGHCLSRRSRWSLPPSVLYQ